MSRLVSYAYCLVVAVLVLIAFSPRDYSERDNESFNVLRAQFNDLVAVNDRFVAVGERGTIVVSEDYGETWSVTHNDDKVPVTLTNVTALNETTLLAVGHDSVILRSEDAGLSWELIMRDSETGEPFMGAWSADGENVFVYGSFGKFLHSSDAGKSFSAQELDIYGEHLSAMDGDTADVRILVGEMGLVLRSLDGGFSWHKLEPFYQGSLFGVAHLNGTRWIAYGMRGHVFFSENNGDSWSQVDIGSELPLYGHAVAMDGKHMVVVGTAGIQLALNDKGELMEVSYMSELGTLTSALILPGGSMLVAGQRGLMQSFHNQVAAWSTIGVEHE